MVYHGFAVLAGLLVIPELYKDSWGEAGLVEHIIDYDHVCSLFSSFFLNK